MGKTARVCTRCSVLSCAGTCHLLRCALAASTGTNRKSTMTANATCGLSSCALTVMPASQLVSWQGLRLEPSVLLSRNSKIRSLAVGADQSCAGGVVGSGQPGQVLRQYGAARRSHRCIGLSTQDKILGGILTHEGCLGSTTVCPQRQHRTALLIGVLMRTQSATRSLGAPMLWNRRSPQGKSMHAR